jgi:hydrogenase expression/formation protein HypD
MRFIDEFRDVRKAGELAAAIGRQAVRPVSIMEVCGTHTVAIFRHGLRELLPNTIRLISGPGCPVCVTPTTEIDRAIGLARNPEVTLATFGDMLRVPGSVGSLQVARAGGCDVRIVYSARDALQLALASPGRAVIFLAVGFETTSPTVAATVREARQRGVENFFVLSAHKLIPPAMRALLEAGEAKIDGFLCPGHVSVIIGSAPYEFIPQEYGVPCVIAGFEPLDILQGVAMLVAQQEAGRPAVEIQYRRGVRPEGNQAARECVGEVFEVCETEWRGLGTIPASGLRLRPEFEQHEAARAFPVRVSEAGEPPGCRCGDVLRGVLTPDRCPLFERVCRPEQPVGPCMVSSEGTCAAWHQYGSERGWDENGQ